MKLIASFLAAALALSVAGVASAEPRDVRETRSQQPREVRERPVKERVVIQREHRETRAREATSTRSGRSSVVRQGKQLFYKVCMRGPQDCR
jgi:hypothetical protein